MARGDVFEVMPLIQNQTTVRRQHRRLLPVILGLPNREVSREQVVVDDHDVGLGGTASSPEEETAVEVLALEPSAEVGLRTDFIPYLGRGHDGKIAQGTVGGVTRPLGNGQELVELLGLEEGALRADRLMEPRQAEIVPPALEQGERGGIVVVRECPPQQRQVLPHQLLLQVDRVGAHDRALAVGARPLERGQKIRE